MKHKTYILPLNALNTIPYDAICHVHASYKDAGGTLRKSKLHRITGRYVMELGQACKEMPDAKPMKFSLTAKEIADAVLGNSVYMSYDGSGNTYDVSGNIIINTLCMHQRLVPDKSDLREKPLNAPRGFFKQFHQREHRVPLPSEIFSKVFEKYLPLPENIPLYL